MPSIYSLVLFLLLSCASSLSSLYYSTDNLQTFHQLHPFPSTSLLPHQIQISTSDSPDSPSITLPSCLLNADLAISVFADSNPLFIRLDSPISPCPIPKPSPQLQLHTVPLPTASRPQWYPLTVRVTPKDEEDETQAQEQEKGWWGTYGLYVMLFVGAALGQGIRKGMVELREEYEKEEAMKEMRARQTPNFVVKVPRKGAKNRKPNKASKS